MKKIILLLLITVLFFGCSSSDDSSSDSNIFNPPSWIHGTWGIKNTDNSGIRPVFRFTSDNICQIFATTTVCWKEAIEEDVTKNLSGDDTSSNNTYSASLLTSNTLHMKISFEKVSFAKILYVTVDGDIELEKMN